MPPPMHALLIGLLAAAVRWYDSATVLEELGGPFALAETSLEEAVRLALASVTDTPRSGLWHY
jgi:hypothetical protein